MNNTVEKIKTANIVMDIIYLCKKHKLQYSNTKVQKLLYLFIGFCLMNDIEEIKNT